MIADNTGEEFWAREMEHPHSGALVIGGDYRGLGAVRSLGRHGVPVWVLTGEHRLAGASRYVQRSMPFPETTDDEQVAFLCNLAREHDILGWVLFPSGDEAAAMIARNHAILSRYYVLTTPPWDSLRWAYDKRLTYTMAQDLGLAAPRTYYPSSLEELSCLELEFPVLLKPAYKREINEFTHSKAWQVENWAELLARYSEASDLVEPEAIMVQELIPGGGEAQYSFGALCKEGRPVASIVARRTRQYPIDFGRASTYVESIEAPEVETMSRIVLAHLSFTGLIEVEFKFDARDGCLKLLDLNPRMWGWHTLGSRAGVDFTYLQWRLATDQPVSEVRARPGVHWVRMLQDVPALAAYVRSGQLSLPEYLRSLRGPLETAILAKDDMKPALVELPQMFQLAMARRRAA